MGLRNLVVDFPRESLMQSLGGKPREPVSQPPDVDERFLQETAAGVLYGSSMPEEARTHIREFHRSLVLEWGREERQRRSGTLLGTQEHLRRSKSELETAEERLAAQGKYVDVPFKASEVHLRPWTVPVYLKAGFLVLAILAAYLGGIVTISSTIQSNPAFHSVIKSYTIAITFVVLPALVLSLGYAALLKKNPDAARRFRKVLLIGVISSFLLACFSYALLYTPSGNPSEEIDLTALVDATAAPNPGPSEFERRLYRVLPAFFIAMAMALDWLSSAYCKTHLTEIFLEYGWPRPPRKQVNSEWAREEAARRKASEQVAGLRGEEESASIFLRDYDQQIESQATRLCTAALSKFAPMVDAALHCRRMLPLVFNTKPKTPAGLRRRKGTP